MNIFLNAFGRERKPNKKKRSFTDLFRAKNLDYVAYFQNATAQYLNGNNQSALTDINLTIENSDINDWQHYAFRGNVYEDLQNYNQAIKDYEQGIEFNSDDLQVYPLYHQIGFCYLSLGNDKKASEFYTYAIDLKKLHPNSAYNKDLEGMDGGIMRGLPFKRMFNNRANAFKNLNKLNEAIEDCKQAITYDQNYSNPYLLLSQIYSVAGQNQEAIKYLKISAQLGNQNAISTLRQLGG
ncbi:tetratricopeptide (TPR) repeat protein [Pedobacter sp. UYP30]|uniref:tetratricopeptide repeat protein n=1 Tax=Pedobacter sp. UYP30 TaxID=1756400 RepID=UPI0033940423